MCPRLGTVITWKGLICAGPSLPFLTACSLYHSWQLLTLFSKYQANSPPCLSEWTCQPAKEISRWRNCCSFINTGAQVPFPILLQTPFHPTQLLKNLSCSCTFNCMRDHLRLQLVFCKNCSTWRCIFNICWGGELYVLLLSHLDLFPSIISFIKLFTSFEIISSGEGSHTSICFLELSLRVYLKKKKTH